jgi:hypothetical protein
MIRICPRCGAISDSMTNPTCYNCVRIEQEQKRYGRRRPYRSYGAPPRPPGKPPKKKRSVRPPEVVKKAVNRDLQRKAINQLLSDLYQPNSRLLSHILRDGGLNSLQISRLRKEHLAEYLDALVAELLAFWSKVLRWQAYEMLRAKYALDGKQPPLKSSLMKQFNFSRKQIERYQEEGLRQLRFASNITHWEKLVVKTARTVLLRAYSVGRRSSR